MLFPFGSVRAPSGGIQDDQNNLDMLISNNLVGYSGKLVKTTSLVYSTFYKAII